MLQTKIAAFVAIKFDLSYTGHVFYKNFNCYCPNIMMDTDRTTLTQRRSSTSGVSKLQKSKLESIGEFEEESGGGAKVIVWVVIVLVLAAAAYFGIKTYLQNGDNNANVQTTPTVTPTPSLEDMIVADTVLADSLATDAPEAADYSLDKQALGKKGADTYTLSDLMVQPYDSFLRVEFTVAANTDTSELPKTTATFSSALSEISLAFETISSDQTNLPSSQSVNIDNSNVVSGLTHKASEGQIETYVLTLEAETGYYLHSVVDGTSTKIVLDILEVTAEVTPDVTTTVAPTDAEIEPTDEVISGVKLNNSFSTGSQKIVTNTTGNTVTISKYSFYDIGDTFTFKLFLTGGTEPFPNADATLADKKLTVVISNLKVDGVSGNGGTGSRDLNAAGVDEVNSFTVSNSSNKSTYVFDLDENYQYRMYIDQDNDQLVIEIKH